MGVKLASVLAVMAATGVFPSGTELAVTATMDVAGLWLTPDGNSVIEIADCGDGTPCGRVVWVNPEGGMTVDMYNNDPDMRNRAMEGITLLGGFERHGDGWRGGEIYNPENGKTYGCRLKRMDDETLEVKGCVGPFCKGLTWQAADTSHLRQAQLGIITP